MMKKTIWLCVMAVAAGCASAPKIPPISDSQKWLPGKVVWRDLITPDPKAAESFYGEMFGWTFEPVGDTGYSTIRRDGVAIGGMVDANKIGTAPRSSLWLCSVSVDDVKAAVTKVEKAGGRVVRGLSNIPDRGYAAIIEDADGALIQLLHATGGDPADVEPAVNEWLWTELIADDAEGAGKFYADIFGYKIKKGPEGADKSYRVLESSGVPRAGILENPFENTRSAWIPGLRVKSAENAAKKAEKLGATIVVKPEADKRGGTVALVLDPSGAPLILQEWSAAKKGDRP